MNAMLWVWLSALSLAVVVALLRTPKRSARKQAAQAPSSALKTWMIIVFGLWASVVLVGAAATHAWSSAGLCETTTVTRPAGDVIEKANSSARTPSSAPTGSSTIAAPPTQLDTETNKTVSTPAFAETTEVCRGLGAAQAAFLLMPGLLVFLPAISKLDIAGILSLSFREVERKVEEQARKVDRVVDDINQLRISQSQLVATGVQVNLDLSSVGDALRHGYSDLLTGKVVPFSEVFSQAVPEATPPPGGGTATHGAEHGGIDDGV